MPKKAAEILAKPLVQRIHEAYSELPDGELRIAEAVLRAPADLAVLTASELAVLSGVSNATVTRFFRRLDYSNFEEARQAARHLRAAGSPLFTGRSSGKASDPISAVIREETAILEATLTQLNPLTLRDIAQSIARANRIRTLGYRNSHILAQYTTAQLAQIRPGVAPLLLPGQTLSEGITALGPNDLAIVIGLRRRPKGFVRTVEAIAKRGTKLLLLADQTLREAQAFATWTLDCAVATPQFADSYVGAISLLRLLTLESERALGETGRRHLEEVEDLRGWLDELE